MQRHPRAFWADLVADVERGASVGAVARRHGVHPSTLRWWRSEFRRDAAPAVQRLVPVVVSGARVATVSAPDHTDIALRGLVLRIPTGTDIAYAADLVRALEPC
jgi:transposase-like protein